MVSKVGSDAESTVLALVSKSGNVFLRYSANYILVPQFSEDAGVREELEAMIVVYDDGAFTTSDDVFFDCILQVVAVCLTFAMIAHV